jgi:hypothetical protein
VWAVGSHGCQEFHVNAHTSLGHCDAIAAAGSHYGAPRGGRVV